MFSHFHIMTISGLQKQLRYLIYSLRIVLLKFISNKAVVNNGIYQFLLLKYLLFSFFRPLHFVKVMLDEQANINI